MAAPIERPAGMAARVSELLKLEIPLILSLSTGIKRATSLLRAVRCRKNKDEATPVRSVPCVHLSDFDNVGWVTDTTSSL